MSNQPEVAVITQWGPDHAVIRSFVSQLLEHGIHFEQGESQSLLAELPEDLSPYRAIALDQPAMQMMFADPAARERLERFSVDQGFVFQINDPTEGKLAGFNANCMVDLSNLFLEQDMCLHAGLSRYKAGWDKAQLDRSDDDLLNGLIDSQVRRVKGLNDWSEMNLHWWKGLQAAIDLGGRDDLKPVLIESVRKLGADIPPVTNHDKMGGFFATVWLKEQTGDDGPLQQAIARTDEVIARRPRNMGIITGCGFTDDPLGVKQGDDGIFTFFFSNSNNRRATVWCEGFHLYAPGFAAITRATGNRKYLDEMVLYVEHLRKYHVREDNLLAHATRHGEPHGEPWARSNLHGLMGCVYMLNEMQRDDPTFDTILDLLNTIGQGLIRFQDEKTGLWRNVINHPDARLEASAAAGFAYIFARCMREGWLDRDTFEPMVRNAWQGLKRMYWRGGFAANCRGSGASADPWYYLGRPQGFSNGPPTSWTIMAALELQQLDQKVTA